MIDIPIKVLDEGIPVPAYAHAGDAGLDLRCTEDFTLSPFERAAIPTGIAVELPEGYEAHVVARSSSYRNFGIIQTNTFGVVDESYCGDNDEWCFPVIALRDTVIHVNDRIAQFRIEKHQPRISFAETEHLSGEDRGGFGTTGIQ